MQHKNAISSSSETPLWVETITADGETVMIKQASALTVVINLGKDMLTEDGIGC